MKQELNGLSQRYVTALRKHLQQGHRTISWGGAALRPGRQALVLGLETLERTRIHGQVITLLGFSRSKDGQIHRARFFTDVITRLWKYIAPRKLLQARWCLGYPRSNECALP